MVNELIACNPFLWAIHIKESFFFKCYNAPNAKKIYRNRDSGHYSVLLDNISRL